MTITQVKTPKANFQMFAIALTSFKPLIKFSFVSGEQCDTNK